MFVDSPALDWVTLTSFEEDVNSKFREILRIASKVDKVKDMKIPRYRGLVADNVFLGIGEQSRTSHFLFQLRGGSAHEYYEDALKIEGAKCTRVDAQVTVEMLEGYSARRIHDTLKVLDWPDQRGGRRALNLVENEGMDTIYIGSIHSEKRICIYVKEGEHGRLYVRFEVRYKKDKAKRAWERMKVGTFGPGDMVGNELALLPRIDDFTWSMFWGRVQDYREGIGATRKIVEKSSTYIWFQKSVIPSLNRLLNDHDYGPDVAVQLQEVLENWVNQDL